MKEEFKDIPGYEGLYQVSNLGNVKSLSRIKLNRGKYPQRLEEIILKTGITGCGYKAVCLRKDGAQKTLKNHKLVAIAFLNHVPCGYKLVVNHKNLDKLDNRLENLEIVTQRENANHKHIKSTSEYTGVSWAKDRNKWRAVIKIGNKNNHLGSFDSEIDAHNAYQKALNELI